MRIELLYFSGCPSAEPTHRRLAELLKSRGRSDRIERVRVTDGQDAVRQRFLGSPTVRIDGEDIEPAASTRTDYGLSCRMYPSGEQELRKVPDDELISHAMDRAINQSSRDATRMPLRFRRMVLIGGLAILLGAFLGLIVVWGQAIAVSGAALVAAAYANNGNEHTRQPYVWWAGVAGAIWAAATMAYWWLWRSRFELIAAQEPLSAVYDFQQPLFYIGLSAFGLMAAATAIGTVSRYRAHKARRYPGA